MNTLIKIIQRYNDVDTYDINYEKQFMKTYLQFLRMFTGNIFDKNEDEEIEHIELYDCDILLYKDVISIIEYLYPD